jgi:hypothetical protein
MRREVPTLDSAIGDIPRGACRPAHTTTSSTSQGSHRAETSASMRRAICASSRDTATTDSRGPDSLESSVTAGSVAGVRCFARGSIMAWSLGPSAGVREREGSRWSCEPQRTQEAWQKHPERDVNVSQQLSALVQSRNGTSRNDFVAPVLRVQREA